MSRSKNSPFKGDKKWGEFDAPGKWSGIKELRKRYNRRTRHTFRTEVRSKHWEDLDEFPEYEDFRRRDQAKWDL